MFQDNGFQKEYFQHEFDLFDGTPLHPVQFLELVAKAACKHSLLDFSPQYTSGAADSPDAKVTVIPVAHPKGNIWRDWNSELYSHVFCSMARRSSFVVPNPEDMYAGELHMTWLRDENGNPRKMTEEDEMIVPKQA